MSDSSTPPPPPTPQRAKKKGISPLAWALIGCLGLMVLIGGCFAFGTFFLAKKAKNVIEGVAADFEDDPALAAAQMLVGLNPDLELVESDSRKGTFTIRDKKGGEVVTVDYHDIEKGRLSFDTGEGRVTVGVPLEDDGRGDIVGLTFEDNSGESKLRFGSAAPQEAPEILTLYPGSAAEGTYSTTTAEVSAGAYSMTTTDSVAEVLRFYAEDLANQGFEISQSNMSGPGGESGTVQGSKRDPAQSVTIIVSSDGSQTRILANYSIEKPR